jgi:hypothetical protein
VIPKIDVPYKSSVLVVDNIAKKPEYCTAGSVVATALKRNNQSAAVAALATK